MERDPETLKLTDQYIALFVMVFTRAGLLDVSIFNQDIYSAGWSELLSTGSHLHAGGNNHRD
jgi:hypothetical protein